MNVGEWLGRGADEISQKWRVYMAPILLQWGVTMAGAIVLGLFAFAAAIASTQIDNEVVMYSIIALGVSFFVFLMVLLVTPISLGFTRGTLSAMRGGEFRLAELWEAFEDTHNIVALMLLNFLVLAISLPFMGIPYLFFGLYSFFAMIVMADERCGPIESITRSFEIVSGNAGKVLVFYGLAIFIMAALNGIPILGPMIGGPFLTAMMIAAYLDLTQTNA